MVIFNIDTDCFTTHGTPNVNIQKCIDENKKSVANFIWKKCRGNVQLI